MTNHQTSGSDADETATGEKKSVGNRFRRELGELSPILEISAIEQVAPTSTWRQQEARQAKSGPTCGGLCANIQSNQDAPRENTTRLTIMLVRELSVDGFTLQSWPSSYHPLNFMRVTFKCASTRTDVLLLPATLQNTPHQCGWAESCSWQKGPFYLLRESRNEMRDWLLLKGPRLWSGHLDFSHTSLAPTLAASKQSVLCENDSVSAVPLSRLPW